VGRRRSHPRSAGPHPVTFRERAGLFPALPQGAAGRRGGPAQTGLVEGELEYLEQLAHDLAMAENRPEIDAVALALAEGGYLKRKRRPSPPPAAPRRFTSPDGFTVWVGRNAAQNEDLTFKRAAPDDAWLHARGVPGAHVVIHAEGRPVPDSTLEWAAGWPLITRRGARYASRSHRHPTALRAPAQGRPAGQVTVRHERTLQVKPQMGNDKD